MVAMYAKYHEIRKNRNVVKMNGAGDLPLRIFSTPSKSKGNKMSGHVEPGQ